MGWGLAMKLSETFFFIFSFSFFKGLLSHLTFSLLGELVLGTPHHGLGLGLRFPAPSFEERNICYTLLLAPCTLPNHSHNCQPSQGLPLPRSLLGLLRCPAQVPCSSWGTAAPAPTALPSARLWSWPVTSERGSHLSSRPGAPKGRDHVLSSLPFSRDRAWEESLGRERCSLMNRPCIHSFIHSHSSHCVPDSALGEYPAEILPSQS